MKENKVRFLAHWWDSKSGIDPSNLEREYFDVTYDNKGREVKIERFDKNGNLLRSECRKWRGSWLVEAVNFTSDGKSQRKTKFHYSKLGFLVEKKMISSDGTDVSILPDSEEDIIDKFGEWLFHLLRLPIVEAKGFINFFKR